MLQCGHYFCKLCLETIAEDNPQGSVTCCKCDHITDTNGKAGVNMLREVKYITELADKRRLEDIRKRLTDLRANSMGEVKSTENVTQRLQQTLDTAVNIQMDFKSSIANIKQSLKDLQSKVENVEQEVSVKMATGITEMQEMSRDMKCNLESNYILIERLTYLIHKASDTEVIDGALDQYNTGTDSHSFSEPEILLPQLGSKLSDIKDKIDQCQDNLNISYTKYILIEEQEQEQEQTHALPIDLIKHTHGDEYATELEEKGHPVQSPKDILHYSSETNIQTHKMNNEDQEGISNVLPLPIKQLARMACFKAGRNTHGLAIDSVRERLVVRRWDTTTFRHPFNVSSGQYDTGDGTKPVIIVSDYSNHCIKLLDYRGKLLYTYGQEGKAGRGGQLHYPDGVCMGPGGQIIVCDYDNNRVVSFYMEDDN